MAKSKIQQTIRKSVEGVLNLDGGKAVIEVEDIGGVNFADVFERFNGELVKVVVTVSGDGSEDGTGDE